jgi:hypothetical protein
MHREQLGVLNSKWLKDMMDNHLQIALHLAEYKCSMATSWLLSLGHRLVILVSHQGQQTLKRLILLFSALLFRSIICIGFFISLDDLTLSK